MIGTNRMYKYDCTILYKHGLARGAGARPGHREAQRGFEWSRVGRARVTGLLASRSIVIHGVHIVTAARLRRPVSRG